MDGFFFFLIFVFVVVSIFKNMFGTKKSSNKPTGAKQGPWGQNLDQINSGFETRPDDFAANARANNGHGQTRFQAHKRTYPRTQEQSLRDKARDRRQRQTHKRLASSRKTGRDIVQVGNKSRDDWGARGDNGGVGGLVTVIILGVIVFFAISYFAPILMDLLNDF